MVSSLPTVVIVHGAWHIPAHYEDLVTQLRTAGLEVCIPRLPTCDTTNHPGASMYDDVATIRSQVLDLLNQDKDIIMLFHSYGGAVGTQALQGLSKIERQASGQPNGVIHLFYMCAFMLQEGECTSGASLPRPEPECVGFDNTTETTHICQPPIPLLYADVEPPKAQRMADMLVSQSARAGTDVLTFAAWKTIPSTYLVALKDEILFPDWQRRQVQAVRDTGVSVTVREFDCSHSPFLSRTGDIVKVVMNVV